MVCVITQNRFFVCVCVCFFYRQTTACERDFYFGLVMWRHQTVPRFSICCDSDKERFVFCAFKLFKSMQTVPTI